MKRLLILLSVLFLSVMVYAKDINVKDANGSVVARLKLSSGTTYNIYDTKGTKIGTYKATQKLTATYMKGKKFKLIKTWNNYSIKE